MRKPIILRPLTVEEQQAVQAGLRSSQSFTVRRCQVLLASQRGCHADQIADQLSCGGQTVRNILHAFHRRGITSLQPQSKAPRHRPQAVFDARRREQLRDLLHRSPRSFGYPTSLWTLPLAAQVAYSVAITPHAARGGAIRKELYYLRISGKRASLWLKSTVWG